MRDKIISFLLTSILIMLLIIIGILGYTVYCEITGESIIDIQFVGDGGFPTIKYNGLDKETKDVSLDEEMFEGIEETEIKETTSKVQSRNLYNQLNDTGKSIYDKLYQNKENLKTGTYKIDFGNAFQTLLSTENGDVELKKQYQSAIEALLYENPDIFYLDATNMYINIEKITKFTGTKYNVFIDNGSKANYLTEGFNSKQDVEIYEAQIEQVKNEILVKIQGKSDYEKIKIVHDYLIDTVEYDTSLQGNNIYDIYGAFVNKKCVCEGYAKAFQYIMNEVGIENTIVIGEATNSKNITENHAWNYVKLKGQWYAVDVTWDDPVITGLGFLTNKAKYEYFLRGSSTMDKNHITFGKFTDNGQVFTYPKLSIEDYEKNT